MTAASGIPDASGIGFWKTNECPECISQWGRAEMADGAELFYRTWGAQSPDLVFLVHGLGGHSGWYGDLASTLAGRGLKVFAPDLRGFGGSGGKRGHVRRGKQILDDLQQLVRHAEEEHLPSRIHLVGHSMGAVLAVHLAARMTFTSLAVINPWVRDVTRVSSLTVARVLLSGLAGSQRYWKLAGGTEGMTDNPEAAEYLLQDPLWVREETASFFAQILWLRIRLMAAARRVHCPALVIQTREDTVVHHEASQRLYRALASTRKEWATPSGCTHDFEFSPTRSEVDDRLAQWCLGIAENSGPKD